MMSLMQKFHEPRWTLISKKLQELHGISGKTAKQCRERWNNQLSYAVNNSPWTDEEEKQLITLHRKYGNRWAVIAENLTGRPENAVKNHFYSRIRRNLRRHNKKNKEAKILATVQEILNNAELLDLLLYQWSDQRSLKLPEEQTSERKISEMQINQAEWEWPEDQLKREELVAEWMNSMCCANLYVTWYFWSFAQLSGEGLVPRDSEEP